MKDYDYVYHMLKRAEMKKRDALKKGDDLKFFSFSAVVRQLKIVLEVEETKSSKGRLKKIIEFNNSLIE